jgi:hypothetical protein
MTKLLIGCEESGVVRRAARAAGIDAWSNDRQPARDNSPYHIQCDVFDALDAMDWDVIILHPPCTALATSGNTHYAIGRPRHAERREAGLWTYNLWNAAKAKAKKGVALENPRSVIWRFLGVEPHYVQPYQFGHLEQKETGFALDRLPFLKETNNVYDEMMQLPRKERERIYFVPPGKDRERIRSTTYQGIADAMVAQWVLNNG